MNDVRDSLFITFEGIDGAGKSSHLGQVAEDFAASGRRVVKTREPGGTPLAEALRGALLNHAMDTLTETLVVFAARRDHVEKVIRPALARGDVVLCDRFSDSSFAYQGSGRRLAPDILARLDRWVTAELQPDLTFWFDLDPKMAAARLVGSRTKDRFESEEEAFFAAVRQGYEKRAAEFPGRVMRIEADGNFSDICEQIRSILRERGAAY